MWERIRWMVIKEFIQILRDKRMGGLVFIAPIIQILVIGYAVTTDVNNVPTAIYDQDKSQESRELVQRMEASGYFEIKYQVQSPQELTDLLERGRVLAAMEFKPGFASDLNKGNPVEVQVLMDGSDSNTAQVALGYVKSILTRYSQEKSPRNLKASFLPLSIQTRAWYNPDLRSRNYNVPGVIALMVMIICLLLTSMAVVREREIGTMEQLMVTPLKPLELILGKTIPFACIGFIDMFLVTIIGVNWFNIPIVGSLLQLTISTGIYLLSILGVGLFISTVTKSQQQALMASFLFFAPAILLSGFMFPIDNMPRVIQYITYLNPLRYFLVIVRGIFLKGVGFNILWPQMAALFTLGLSLLTLSVLRFHKRMA